MPAAVRAHVSIPDEYLDYGIPCWSVLLTRTDSTGRLGCRSDVLSEPLQFADALPPGTVVAHGTGFTCTLLEVGAVCSNQAGGEVEITADAYRLTR